MKRLFFFALGYLLPGLLLTLWFGIPTACDKEDVPVVTNKSERI